MLLEIGADPDAVNGEGVTALEVALKWNSSWGKFVRGSGFGLRFGEQPGHGHLALCRRRSRLPPLWRCCWMGGRIRM